MKPVFALALAALLLGACESPSGHSLRKEDIAHIVSKYGEALSNRDQRVTDSITTSNFVLYLDGEIYNNNTAIKEIGNLPPFRVSFKIDSLNAYIDKSYASAYYIREANAVVRDTTQWNVRFLESATFHREGKIWKIRFLHITSRY